MSQFENCKLPSCHGERSPNDPELAKGREGESNHPENVYFNMPRQGILPRHRHVLLANSCRGKKCMEENSLMLHGKEISSGCFDLCSSRLRRDSQVAQHDKSEASSAN
jgi:hypothetical protein